ncbi:hypothetical protein [Streptomyces sp. NPDC002644]
MQEVHGFITEQEQAMCARCFDGDDNIKARRQSDPVLDSNVYCVVCCQPIIYYPAEVAYLLAQMEWTRRQYRITEFTD